MTFAGKKTGSLHNPPPRLCYPPPMIGRMLFSCLWSAVLCSGHLWLALAWEKEEERGPYDSLQFHSGSANHRWKYHADQSQTTAVCAWEVVWRDQKNFVCKCHRPFLLLVGTGHVTRKWRTFAMEMSSFLKPFLGHSKYNNCCLATTYYIQLQNINTSLRFLLFVHIVKI